MKIATFNINNINKRLANLLDWLRAAKPDIICLQELKAADSEFPKTAIEKAGYGAAWRGERSWNGVAILARGREPVVTRTDLPGDPADTQSRYIEAAVNGVIITSLYAPNGNPQPGPKFNYKLAWLERLAAHAAELYAAGVPVVLAGDYNVVPTDQDIYPTKSYAKDALLQPESRRLFQRILDQGWVDAIRTRHPDAPMYTYWDYMRNRWPRDGGLRIDHLLLSAQSAARLVDAGVDRDVRAKDGASDHAPAWIVLRDDVNSVRTSPEAGAKRAQDAGARSAVPANALPGRRPLLAVDGDSFTHRSYHALPKTILRRGGRPAGAILGFAIFCCGSTARSSRAQCWSRGTRWRFPPIVTSRFRPIRAGGSSTTPCWNSSRSCRNSWPRAAFANAKRPVYEADDFLASAVAAEERRGGTILVASGDRDTFQLASESTTILYPVRAGEMARIGPAEVRARYGVDPKQVPDFIALRGDPSDKLPGAPGVGPTGAAQLLRTYGSLENALKAGRFPTLAERLRLFRSIATMDAKAPLPRLAVQKPTWAKAAALAREWELNQLADRLEGLA